MQGGFFWENVNIFILFEMRMVVLRREENARRVAERDQAAAAALAACAGVCR